MGKIAEKQNSKRLSILDSAYELFTSKSFAGTSIDDVVRKAGIAKGTFYLYFKDKYDLMDRIVAHKSLSILREALDGLEQEKQSLGNEMSFTQQMLFLVNRIMDYMQENKELLALVDKKLSKCIGSFASLSDAETAQKVTELIKQSGTTKEETIKKIYLIVDLIGSVGFDSIIYESPFKLDDIKPMLFSTVEKILA